MVSKQIKAIGRVQGVFFRDSTKKMADKLGVKGWVRNEADGSVLIEAEAEADAMEQFLTWCSSGPEFARVDELKVNDRAPSGFTSFEVKR